MAGAGRTTAADLKDWLLREARSVAFFQAVRLLRLTDRQQKEDPRAAFDWSGLRIRTNLSLAFPENDIEELTPLPDGSGMRLTANFFGLYGVSSPLPTFYTEDLLDEASRDISTQRDFLDIFHFALYPLMYDAWAKYRNAFKVVEEADRDYLDRLLALVGFHDEPTRRDLPKVPSLLRYAGLFTQYPRSAMGLETLLSDAADGTPVSVQTCVATRLLIPADQRTSLGGRGAPLGVSTYLGQEMADRMSTITIRIGPTDADGFHELLPWHEGHNELRFLVRMYLTDPLRSNVELVLERGAVRPARLGGNMWNQLGLDTWSFAGDWDKEVAVNFALYS
jgi:type VI secretion system protein ImpH